ncbi:MAG: DUF512 domain-containing protein [Acidimicrobiales bacterium]|nr:DUF512 domain-containing protein [Acidimicrobiales bacterium]
MSSPRVISVVAGSPAHNAGIEIGDEIISIDGERPRDLIRWTWLTDEPSPVLEVERGGLELTVEVEKEAGEQLGIEVHSALFDQLRTCDNHCEFCFIYQLPPGLRPSLYQKDDDYRLSFLYGNFTTLTRFTEADLERVITEGLSPLNVSIHAIDHAARNDLLRNRRGGPSLRWLRALLDHDVEIHGQIVCCPGVNDGDVLEQTLAGVLEQYPELASVCVVPLGVSKFNTEPRMRPSTRDEARVVIECIERWQDIFLSVLGRRMVHVADEYYLLAQLPFPEAEVYEGFAMYEDGVGMGRTFESEFLEGQRRQEDRSDGFFAWADRTSAPAGSRYEAAADLSAPPTDYRGPRSAPTPPEVASTAGSSGATLVMLRPRTNAPVGVLTGEASAPILRPLIESLGRDDVRVVPVPNEYFGGSTSVTGLLVGEDLARVLGTEPEGHRYLLADVCLSGGRFLDGSTPDDLPRYVEVIPTDGAALRQALES